MMSKKQNFILFGLSYVGWFGCVFAGKFELGAIAYLVPIIYFISFSRYEKISMPLVSVFAAISFIGIIFDSISLHFQWIKLTIPHEQFGLPHWLNSLWLLFAFSIPMYDSWLKNRYFFTAGLGFFLGPITYFSGAGFGVLAIDNPIHLLYYALFWCSFFPFCIWLFSAQQKTKS